MDITKRMLLIVSISLARNDSRILARSSGADIRSDCASCLYDGSLPSFSFSLNSKLGTTGNQLGNWNPLDTLNLQHATLITIMLHENKKKTMKSCNVCIHFSLLSILSGDVSCV